MSIYNNLHSSIHAKNTHVKVHHCVSRSASSFGWVTPLFELYCVAEPNANRNALVQCATKIAQWVQQEEERLFIIGGAVSPTSRSLSISLDANRVYRFSKATIAITLWNEDQQTHHDLYIMIPLHINPRASVIESHFYMFKNVCRWPVLVLS
jgi:hypothetical protein